MGVKLETVSRAQRSAVGACFFPESDMCEQRSHGFRALLCPGGQPADEGARGLYHLHGFSHKDSFVLILFLPWSYLDTGRKGPSKYQGCGCGVQAVSALES